MTAPRPTDEQRSGHTGDRFVRLTRPVFSLIVGYAVGLTATMLFLLLTGRVALQAVHPLESLPDLRPLPASEFRRVPAEAELPEGHVLRLKESRRFGDVRLTPVRVTLEPLEFEGFLTGAIEPQLTTAPTLKLWLRFENVAADYAFPPYDAWLMASRSPPDGTDASTAANSFLTITDPVNATSVRVLNYLQLPDSNFHIRGQNAGTVALPGDPVTIFVACDPSGVVPKPRPDMDFTWRIQFRKGVGAGTSGVTTLIDVQFAGNDVEVL